MHSYTLLFNPISFSSENRIIRGLSKHNWLLLSELYAAVAGPIFSESSSFQSHNNTDYEVVHTYCHRRGCQLDQN